MKKIVFWIGLVFVLAIELFVVITAYSSIKNVPIFCGGGIWLWRGIAAGFLKIKGVYNLELTRKREIILAVTDGLLGLAWVAIALFAGTKQTQINLILLSTIPSVIATAAASYYKTE